MIESTMRTVRELSGVPISILFALAAARQPVEVAWLEAATDFSYNTLAKNLRYLQENGYVTRNGRYAWQLAEGAKQLPLISNLLEDPEDAGLSKFESPHDDVNIIDLKESTTTDINGDSQKLKVAENQAALEEIGVTEPKRSRLAKMPAVNPRMIRYHAHCAAAARSARNPTGLAISLIERGSPAPEDWIDPADAPPEPTQESEPEPLEVLTPLSVAQAQAWTAAVAGLPVSRAERETWLRSPPAGVSTETGALVLRVANRPAAEWIHAHALDDLQRAIGGPVRLEVGHG